MRKGRRVNDQVDENVQQDRDLETEPEHLQFKVRSRLTKSGDSRDSM